MLLVRALFVLVLMLFLMRGRYKELMWTSIPNRMFPPLIIRSFSGLLAFLCINYALKHLPLVLVSLILNTLPLFTSLLGFIILRERTTILEVGCLILALFGVYVLLSSGYSAGEKDDQGGNISIFPLVLLILAPILMSITNVVLRHMRSLHEYTATMYSVVTSIVVFGILIPSTG